MLSMRPRRPKETSSKIGRSRLPTIVSCLLLLSLASTVTARAILGVDLGSSFMKVALVRPGKALEIVTNLHSKRKTENMILFDSSQRSYGADASALLSRKSQKTAAAMTLVLGRGEDNDVAKVLKERHYPITPVFNETRNGVEFDIPNAGTFTPEELTAMVLQHAAEISKAYAISAGGSADLPKDVVITVPSFASDIERRSYQVAARMAGLNVLSLIDETVAAALQYAMDKDFAESEQVVMFYNMGASSTQVVIAHFYNYDQPQKYGKSKSVPALAVVAKAWDATVGGQSFDHRITEYLADQLNAKLDYDVRTQPRTMTKLRLEANKIKHVLSANTERPISLDHDNVHLSLTLTRAQFEEMCADLIDRALVPVTTALEHVKDNFNVTAAQVLGGGMRIPAVQARLDDALPVSLDKNMNADEAMALGAAFFGANISTAFRVRSIGMTDVNPLAVGISMENIEPLVEEEETWSKEATIFKSWGKVGVKKTIAFTHDQDVHAGLKYTESGEPLERYNITGIAEFAKEMEPIGKPKVSLQFEMSTSGIVSLTKAEAAVEELYTVEEEVEVDDDEEGEGENATKTEEESKETKEEESADAAETKEAADATNETIDADADSSKNETTEEPKKKKKIKVEKEKKKVHKKSLTVDRYFVGRIQPLSESLFEASKAKLLEMDLKDKERIMLEESRNKFESYIYRVKNQLVDNEAAITAVTTEKQREEMSKLATTAEEWLDDEGYKADLATTEDKYAELSTPFGKIELRIEEASARPEAIEKMRKLLSDVEATVETWAEEKPQITEKERKEVLKLVEESRKWIDDKEKKQSKKKPHEDPVFLSSEIPGQLSTLRQKVKLLNKRPKPKPKVEKKSKEEDKAANSTDSDGKNATDSGESKESSEEGTSEQTKTDDSEAPAEESAEEEATESTKEETTSTTEEKEGVADEL